VNRDFVDLLAAFNDHGVEYLVVGAHALAAHGHVRATKDLDIWVRPDRDNAPRVIEALVEFGAPLHDLTDVDLSAPGLVFQIGVPPLRVDVITDIDGVEFAAAWPDRVEVKLDDIPVQVISRRHLLANKKASGRLQDLADVERLEQLAEPAVSRYVNEVQSATFDTNVFPADPLIERAHRLGLTISVISVTKREAAGSSIAEEVDSLKTIHETCVVGESQVGKSVVGDEQSNRTYEKALKMLSNGSFPAPGSRDSLSDGHLHILRDAMILCAHMRENTDVLVTNDRKGFIDHGRREAIEWEFSVRVMTVDEFEDHLGRLEFETE